MLSFSLSLCLCLECRSAALQRKSYLLLEKLRFRNLLYRFSHACYNIGMQEAAANSDKPMPAMEAARLGDRFSSAVKFGWELEALGPSHAAVRYTILGLDWRSVESLGEEDF